MRKWYHSGWVIGLLFAAWPFIVPPILGIVCIVQRQKLDKAIDQEIFQYQNNAAIQQQNYTQLYNRYSELKGLELEQIQIKLAALEKEYQEKKANAEGDLTTYLSTLNTNVATKQSELSQLENQHDVLQKEVLEKEATLNSLNDELLMQSFGIYTPKYNCMKSEEYKEKIKQVKEKQRKAIKDKTALHFYDGWTLDNSQGKGRAMNNDNMKMVLLAFNNECDVLINKVKFNNVDRIEERIRKTATKLDNLSKRNKISITKDYLNLKIEELYLSYEYECKKQEEKEEIRRIREEEREAQKLEKELEEERKRIAKERQHYSQALKDLEQQFKDNPSEELREKKEKIESILSEIDKQEEDIDYRETNIKAGYVYIISNIGSFGENVYKIGMTRRLNPEDRVYELGDASVPFKFDVHAMIFSDNAPKLENDLHHAFDDHRINKVNNRKEFFKADIKEIENVVKKHYDRAVEFSYIPEAEQFRETQMMTR